MALPDFGLITKEDKLKLDGISSSTYLTTAAASSTYLTQAGASETYLTIAAASDTYATKAEMREYVRQVLESDTGFVFLDGNSSEVGVISALTKPAPTISANPSSVNKSTGIGTTNITVTTNSSGAISAVLIYNGNTISPGSVYSATDGNIETFTVSENTITLKSLEPIAVGTSFNATLRISVAEDDTYKAGSLDVPITVTGIVM